MARNTMNINPTAAGIEKMGILYYVGTAKYGFNMADMSVAEMIKGYLRALTEESQGAVLGSIVSREMHEVRTDGLLPTVEAYHIPQEQWMKIDGAALTAVINEAKKLLAEEAQMWKAEKGQRQLQRTIDYVREDVVDDMDGAKYVASMPVEMAEFITDCWLAVKEYSYGVQE